jgi:hypothetical protein
MKAALTVALFFLLAVGTVGTFALLAALPWCVAPAIGFGAWRLIKATVEAIAAVRRVPAC